MKSVLAYEGADEMHTVALVRSMQHDPRSTDRARPKTARLPLFLQEALNVTCPHDVT